MATIIINKRQAGNDVIKHIKRCAYTIDPSIEPDFILGRTACALYLSLRFHATQPQYIYNRIEGLGTNFDLRIVLVIVDHIEYQSYLKELSELCIRCSMTMMLAWTIEDAAAILERYKLSESQPAELIMGQAATTDYSEALDQYMIDALTECKSINRSDAASIAGLFDNFDRICKRSPEDLAVCPGVGLNKANRLYSLLHRNIRRTNSSPQKSASSSSVVAPESTADSNLNTGLNSSQTQNIDDY